MLVKQSIKHRLLIGLISAIILTWVIALIFVTIAAQNEVEEIYDATLAQEARVLNTLLSHEAQEEEEIKEKLTQILKELGNSALQKSPILAQVVKDSLSSKTDEDYLTLLDSNDAYKHRYESKIAFIVRYPDNRVMLRSPNAPTFDASRKEGFHTLDIDSIKWRFFSLKDPQNKLLVQVGEKIEIRQETVTYILTNSLWPMIVSLPILSLIIWLTVSKGMKPLQQVADNVEKRDPNSLTPMSANKVPAEVVPMVESLNRLFLRVDQALQNERRFTANAAHELRTPLAALKTYIQAKQLSVDGKEHEQFFREITKRVDRSTHLLEQLLSLARADNQNTNSIINEQVDLNTASLSVLTTLGSKAIDKNINLSFDTETEHTLIQGDTTTIEILIRNLVDNAIRYTPENGTIIVKLLNNESSIEWSISDSGNGIPKDQQALLFQRFQRGDNMEEQGSGLGLAIVKQIADSHHADVSLSKGLGENGLSVTVSFTNQ